MANTTNTGRRDEGRQSQQGQDKGTAGGVIDTAKDIAGNVADKARQAAGTVASTVGNVASSVGSAADSGVSAAGSGMQSLAGTIRDKGPSSGVLGGAASGVASALDASGRYLEEQGLSGIGEDITNLIRRNPIPAMLVGIGLGFLLARMTRS